MRLRSSELGCACSADLQQSFPRHLHKVFVNDALAHRVSNVQRSDLAPDDLLHLLKLHPWEPLGELPDVGASQQVLEEGLNRNPGSPEDPPSAELVGVALDKPAVLPLFPLPDSTRTIGSAG